MDEILNLIESVSEGFPSYSCQAQRPKLSYQKSTPAKTIYGQNRVKVRSTACHYATKRLVKIMYLGLDNIIKLNLTTNCDRCAILNVLSCLTENCELL